jgi:leucine dehydrogenase
MGTFARAFEHEQVEVVRDAANGLTCVVAIHSTALGPAMGGLRIRPYDDLDAAVADALRLSRAMTLKNSAAGLRLGGGKAVVLDDGRWDERDARLMAFGDVVERLGGRYITAEDIGTTPADMDLIATRTSWVVGRSREGGGIGDPSPATARTVLGAIDAAVRSHLGVASLDGIHVGVLGAGKVGAALVAMLAEAGARVSVADVDHSRAVACAAAAGHQVEAVSIDGFVAEDMDVLSPCAVGELIGVEDVAGLKCRVIAGAANNPLIDRTAAVALHEAGVLYVPDFIANSGGIVQVAGEFEGLSPEAIALGHEACIARIVEVLDEAGRQDALPVDVAEELALARVAAASVAA